MEIDFIKLDNCFIITNSNIEEMIVSVDSNNYLYKNDQDGWRKQEKSQINYIQRENAKLLEGLHNELERLQNINRGILVKFN